jgi:hypothetical protein
MSWYPCRRYLSEDGHTEVQMRDDVECGSDWWEIQVCICESLKRASLTHNRFTVWLE